MSKQNYQTPRTEAVIAKVMRAYPGETPKELAAFYEAVHQEIAPLCRELEREVASLRAFQQVPEGWQPLPDAVFNGYAVYQALNDKARQRTSADNVSDVLDALAIVMRASPATGLKEGGK